MRKTDAGELAWELCQKTGNVTYYMLYKQLKKYVEFSTPPARRRFVAAGNEGKTVRVSPQIAEIRSCQLSENFAS